MLSHQLRQSAASSTIPEICVAADLTSTNPKEINNQFKQFYSALYSSEALPDTSCMHVFLDNLDIPCLNSDEQTNMDASISHDEATLAIHSMQSSKTPGPDGFPVEFYKAFSSKLSPILSSMYNEIISSKKLPQILTKATISVLLKKKQESPRLWLIPPYKPFVLRL